MANVRVQLGLDLPFDYENIVEQPVSFGDAPAEIVIPALGGGGGGNYTPGNPPTTVDFWILRATDTPITLGEFLGVHSDWVPGYTYPASGPVSPRALTDNCETVRTLDCDINFGQQPRLSWAAMEAGAPKLYTWTYADQFVAEHSGKRIIWVIDRTPARYAKYTTSYNLYPSYLNSSSPPANWQDMIDYALAIKNRYPGENIEFEMFNEPNFGYAIGAGGAVTESNRFDMRRSDAFIEWAGVGAAFFIGTGRDMAQGAKALYQAGVRPLVVGAWEGQSESNWIGNSFRVFSECPLGDGTYGRDWIDKISVHSYTYNGNMGDTIYDDLFDYRAFANAFGYPPNKPIVADEVGFIGSPWAYELDDSNHADQIGRAMVIAAGLGYDGIHLYKIDSDYSGTGSSGPASNLKWYSLQDTGARQASNAATAGAFTWGSSLRSGKIVRQCARLVDGRYWIELQDGQSLAR